MYTVNACFVIEGVFNVVLYVCFFFFFQAEDGIRDLTVTGVQTCALPISFNGAGQRRRGARIETSTGAAPALLLRYDADDPGHAHAGSRIILRAFIEPLRDRKSVV